MWVCPAGTFSILVGFFLGNSRDSVSEIPAPLRLFTVWWVHVLIRLFYSCYLMSLYYLLFILSSPAQPELDPYFTEFRAQLDNHSSKRRMNPEDRDLKMSIEQHVKVPSVLYVSLVGICVNLRKVTGDIRVS